MAAIYKPDNKLFKAAVLRWWLTTTKSQRNIGKASMLSTILKKDLVV